MKLRNFMILVLLVMSAPVFSGTCFDHEKVRLPSTELHLNSKHIAYERASHTLPKLSDRSFNHCLDEMVAFMLDQRDFKSLIRNLKALLQHNLDNWVLLQQVNGFAQSLQTDHATQRFFVYAIAVGLGFDAAFTYQRSDHSRTEVWLAAYDRLPDRQYL